jgi:hypothetical protein
MGIKMYNKLPPFIKNVSDKSTTSIYIVNVIVYFIMFYGECLYPTVCNLHSSLQKESTMSSTEQASVTCHTSR